MKVVKLKLRRQSSILIISIKFFFVFTMAIFLHLFLWCWQIHVHYKPLIVLQGCPLKADDAISALFKGQVASNSCVTVKHDTNYIKNAGSFFCLHERHYKGLKKFQIFNVAPSRLGLV